VRSLSIDPIVVAQQLLASLHYTTDRGLAVLNDYARTTIRFSTSARTQWRWRCSRRLAASCCAPQSGRSTASDVGDELRKMKGDLCVSGL